MVNGKILKLQKVIGQEVTSPSSRESVTHGNYKTHTFWVLQQHTLGPQDCCMCKHDITSRLNSASLPNAKQPREFYFLWSCICTWSVIWIPPMGKKNKWIRRWWRASPADEQGSSTQPSCCPTAPGETPRLPQLLGQAMAANSPTAWETRALLKTESSYKHKTEEQRPTIPYFNNNIKSNLSTT